jgi:uncharacterized integral membrane protein
MGLSYLVVAVIAVLVTVFALQNTDPATVRFFVWRLDAMPLAGLVLASLGAGLLIAGIPLTIRLSVWRARARSRETRVTMLQTALEERDRQLLRTPPKGPGG